MIYEEIELDYDIEKNSREDIKRLITQGSAEMNAFQHAFIAGLVKKYRPNKIVEIGIAAGGTTCFLHECLKRNSYTANIYSVDKFATYYRIPTKKTGYLVNEMAVCDGYEYITDFQSILIGKSIPSYLERIGDNIDFLIMDTTHALPGELLDFFVCLPYLKEGAVIVLHDTICNMVNNNGSFATKLLFDVVKAKKIVNFNEDEEKYTGFPNIMAFEVTEDTKKNAIDILSSLTCDWKYYLEDDEIEEYSRIICNKYGSRQDDLFRGLCKINFVNITLKYFGDNELLKRWRRLNSPVLIYGNGLWASRLIKIAKYEDLEIAGMVVSDYIDVEKEKNNDYPIYNISKIPNEIKNIKIIYAVDLKHKNQIESYVKESGLEFL